MILAYAIIVIITVALLLRRDLTKLSELEFKGGILILVAILVLFMLQAAVVLYAPGQSTSQAIVLLATNLGVTGLLLFNHHVPGFRLIALGILLNIIVMVANGGWMPIVPETYQAIRPSQTVTIYERPLNSKNIILPRSETNLWFLSDSIPFILLGKRSAISLGDIFLVVGVAQMIFQVTAVEKARKPVQV